MRSLPSADPLGPSAPRRSLPPSLGRAPTEPPPPPAVVRGTALSSERCRCGTWIAEGASTVRIAPELQPLASVVGDRAFCGDTCLRAFLLEALEFFETAGLPRVVTDAPLVERQLRELYALLASERLVRAFDAARGPAMGRS